MTDGITISIVKNNGITQAIKAHVDDLVKSGNAELTGGSISKSEWYAAIDELDKIYDAHKANGETIFTGGKNRDDWHKNYVVKEAQQITFSGAEMEKLYEALGVILKKKETVVVPGPAPADTLVETPVVEDTLVEKPVIKDETEPAPGSEKKKSHKGLWGLLGLGAVALAGLAIYALTRGKGKNAAKEVAKELTPKIENVGKDAVKELTPKIENVGKDAVKELTPKIEDVGKDAVKEIPTPVKKSLNNGTVVIELGPYKNKGNRVKRAFDRRNNPNYNPKNNAVASHTPKVKKNAASELKNRARNHSDQIAINHKVYHVNFDNDGNVKTLFRYHGNTQFGDPKFEAITGDALEEMKKDYFKEIYSKYRV